MEPPPDRQLPSPPPPHAATVDLKTATSSLGPIVVDGNGMPLYFYTKDPRETTAGACAGGFLAIRPVAVASGAAPKADGVTATVSSIKTPDGKEQLALNGMPLYPCAQDAKPGDTLGQRVGGVWYVASPEGAIIK